MVNEQLAFAETGPPAATSARDARGRYRVSPGPVPSSAEVATVEKGEFLSLLSMFQFPNLDPILKHNAMAEGLKLFDRMLATDSDLSAFLNARYDDALHYPSVIRPASNSPAHIEHWRFAKFAVAQIPKLKTVLRSFAGSYARGFAVMEKFPKIVEQGEWRGAVVFEKIVDKPQRWFSFDMQRRLRFKTTQSILPGELMDPEKFIVVSYGTNNSPWGEPVLALVYYPWLLKHHLLKGHVTWLEKWASPLMLAEYDWKGGSGEDAVKTNADNRTKALQVAMTAQSDNAMAVPKGIALRIMEAMRSGSVSYENGIDMYTQMQSRVIAGGVLTSMGAEGGSHALGKVHQREASNKTEVISDHISTGFSEAVVEYLVMRNFGPQDAYPKYEILARDPVVLQAEATIEQQWISNGHKISRAASERRAMIVVPEGPDDELHPPAGTNPAQPTVVNPSLAAENERREAVIMLAKSSGYQSLHSAARDAAEKKLAHVQGKASKALGHAKPAMRKIVKSLGSKVKEKKNMTRVTRASMFKAMKGVSGADQLGQAFETMLNG